MSKNKIYFDCEDYFCCFLEAKQQILVFFLFYVTNKIINNRFFQNVKDRQAKRGI